MPKESILNKNALVNVHPHKFVFDHFKGVLPQKEWHLSFNLVKISILHQIITKSGDKCHSFCDKTTSKWWKTNLWGWTFLEWAVMEDLSIENNTN